MESPYAPHNQFRIASNSPNGTHRYTTQQITFPNGMEKKIGSLTSRNVTHEKSGPQRGQPLKGRHTRLATKQTAREPKAKLDSAQSKS